MSDAIRTHVRKILHAYAADREAKDTKIRDIEASGARIVSGGQISGGDWEITDWRTGARIASGATGRGGYIEAVKRLDPEDRWHHIDHVGEIQELAPTPGVPLSRATALEDWVDSADTPAQEIAEVAGWDVTDVRRCLENIGR